MLYDNKNDTTLTDTKSTKSDAKRSKREDLIEMIVPPEPDEITKIRLEQDIEFVKSRCGINTDLLGCGALNTMET